MRALSSSERQHAAHLSLHLGRTVDHLDHGRPHRSTLNGADRILAQGAPAFVFLKDATVMSNTTPPERSLGRQHLLVSEQRANRNVGDGAPTAVFALR